MKNLVMGMRAFLKAGDTIGIIAVTAPAQPERFEKGVRYLENAGFKTECVLNPTAAYGKNTYLFGSDTPRQRANGLHALFKNPAVKAILATRGSYGAMEVLPHLDLPLIAKNRKPVIGFSDITALLLPLYQRSKCPVIHGPVLEFGFARALDNDEDSVAGVLALIELLSGADFQPFSATTLRSVRGKEKFSGEIIGGNLSIIASMVGTPWQPKTKGKILFLEEVGEGPYRVHRLLLQLKLAGLFDEVSGIILGEFTRCEHPEKLGPTVHEVVEDIFPNNKIPVVRGLPCGHGRLNLPLPFMNISVTKGKLKLLWK